MTRTRLYFLKNNMILANFAANVIGVSVNVFLIRRADIPIPQDIVAITNRIHMVFLPLSFLSVYLAAFIYELPIRRCLNHQFDSTFTAEAITTRVRRRLLNEPFALMVLGFGIWLTAAVVYSVAFSRANASGDLVQLAFLGILTTGLITIATAFFAFEFIMERSLAPHFFPEGGLHSTTKTFRIRIRTRLVVLLCACNLIPLFSIFQVIGRIASSDMDPAIALARLHSAVTAHALVFAAISLGLTFLVSSNLVRSIKDIIQVLRSVKRGRFNQRVRVTSNDEIGYTGDVINEMTEGLKERDQLRHSLDLAREVQQSLLPRVDPRIDGLDISGRSIYCDETGGDYFDYLDMADEGKEGIHVVIGDVSGHGVPSALLMATVRGSLRQRSSLGGDLGSIVSDVNRQLTLDVEESGQFMTLFYLAIDLSHRRLEWVRAGHDPAIRYDPATDTFEELKGTGVVLGLDEDYSYQAEAKIGIEGGQIIVLATDGAWEALNSEGEMFGKKPFLDTIRRNASASAGEISDRIFEALKDFQGNRKAEDDITLVVIKVDGDGA